MPLPYTLKTEDPVLRAQLVQERVHFKPMYEVGKVLKGMQVDKALQYLQQVIDHERAVPFRRYNEGIGHHAQGKEWGCPSARWPEKSCRIYIRLIKNALSGIESKKDLKRDQLVVRHVACNRAAAFRWRRIHQAHGRVKCYASPPTNVQLVLGPPAKATPAAGDIAAAGD